MFALSDADLIAGPILDCPGGASSFGAQVRARGGDVVSVDPMYHASAAEILRRSAESRRRIHHYQSDHPDQFHWPGFFIGVAGVALNYSLVVLIMVCLFVGRVVVRLSRRCAGFHAPAGVLS